MRALAAPGTFLCRPRLQPGPSFMCDGGDEVMAVAVLQLHCLYRGLLAVRRPALSCVLPGAAWRSLRVFSVRKAPELEDNPFYAKYEEKIRQLRSAKPQEFQARLEKTVALKKEPIGQSRQGDFIQLMEQQAKQLGSGASGPGGFTKNKTLASVLNVDLIKEKTAEEIGEIWRQHFRAKDTICAIIPAETFEQMCQRAASCPTFLYPLPRHEGYEFFVGQWSGHELHFTSLINIQTRADKAPSQLVLYHYPELQEDKGIVLMTAEMDATTLSPAQAQCLANQVQLFYGTQRQETFSLVETFNHQPADFKHMSVIAELEQTGVGMGAQAK
ncbi:ATP synthase mitochondrial F1 complex assembly factor 1 [Erpetoichthys calabaricus]|uniref:ATP synthase mitochondrial F1 complex assembly factor 1 n=1 Tax=Erpetoichthys calabaricus TaxID=27687 RepID=UPI002234681B|nr:ATP synthase mitochondrial F1 complex assembly factor 1 [Erpetoichthys calabaricus]